TVIKARAMPKISAGRIALQVQPARVAATMLSTSRFVKVTLASGDRPSRIRVPTQATLQPRVASQMSFQVRGRYRSWLLRALNLVLMPSDAGTGDLAALYQLNVVFFDAVGKFRQGRERVERFDAPCGDQTGEASAVAEMRGVARLAPSGGD